MNIREHLNEIMVEYKENWQDDILSPNFDSAIIGISTQFGHDQTVVYDKHYIPEKYSFLETIILLDTSINTVEQIASLNQELLTMNDFDESICGIAYSSKSTNPIMVAYDINTVLQTLMNSGMTDEEAQEYFEYNQIGAYVGIHTPIFIQKMQEPKEPISLLAYELKSDVIL